MKLIASCISLLVAVMLAACDSKPPPVETDDSTQIFIKSPDNGQVFFIEEGPVPFKVSALSRFGDHSSKVEWTSSVDGYLGTGAEISVALTAGDHVITAAYSDERTSGDHSIALQIKQLPSDTQVNTGPARKRPAREVQDQDGDILVVDYEKDVIIDTSKRLMWQRTPDTYTYIHGDAERLAASSAHGGYQGWRLPEIDELADIANISYDGRDAILNREFVNISGDFWSSTPKTAGYFFGVRHTEKLLLNNNEFFSEKIVMDGQVPSHVRLVRNTR